MPGTLYRELQDARAPTWLPSENRVDIRTYIADKRNSDDLELLTEVNTTHDGLVDAGKCEEALELARRTLESVLAGNVVDPGCEAMANQFVGRVIWEGFHMRLQQNAPGDLVEMWASCLPEGHAAARRCRELRPGFPMSENLLSNYEEAASKFQPFRTGKFTPDGLHERYQKLVETGDARRKSHDYLGAIEAYDAALAVMKEAGYENSDWEGIAHYKIAQSIMNGGRHAAELAAGDYGPEGMLRESQGDLMSRMNALAPRGMREMQAAAKLVPNDGAVQKGLVLCQQWKSNLPWLFEEERENRSASAAGAGSAPSVEDSRKSQQPLQATDKTEASRGCFVATAVYGSPYAEQVVCLREFRDEVLCRTWWGRAVVWLYGKIGPAAARLIENRPRAKTWLRRLVIGPLCKLIDTKQH